MAKHFSFDLDVFERLLTVIRACASAWKQSHCTTVTWLNHLNVCSVDSECWLLVSWWMLSVNFCWVCSQPPVLFLSTGRCASCGENVVGEGTGCTAMDQVFHVDCFVCMTCSTKLRGKPFFAVEKKAYCEPCYIVSNFFPPLHLPRCLVFGPLWMVMCPHLERAHNDMRGGIIGSPVPGMFIYFHIRQPHLTSPKPGELPPLTTHTSSFHLFIWLCFVFGHSMKLSWFPLRLIAFKYASIWEDAENSVANKVNLDKCSVVFANYQLLLAQKPAS